PAAHRTRIDRLLITSTPTVSGTPRPHALATGARVARSLLSRQGGTMQSLSSTAKRNRSGKRFGVNRWQRGRPALKGRGYTSSKPGEPGCDEAITRRVGTALTQPGSPGFYGV